MPTIEQSRKKLLVFKRMLQVIESLPGKEKEATKMREELETIETIIGYREDLLKNKIKLNG